MSDLYDILNVSRGASVEEIRNGYLSMSRIHHPDKAGVSSSSTSAFRNVNQAYKILSDDALREFYNKHGLEATLLAESEWSDEEKKKLVKSDERLQYLQKRVRTLLRSSEELNAQRFLQASGNLTLGSRLLSYSPVYHSWSHSSTTFGISLLTGKYSVGLYSSSHVQRGGAAVSRASVILNAALSPSLSARAMMHVMGGRWPGTELMLQKTISESTVVRQTISLDDIVKRGIVVSTEWIQQLSAFFVGTLGMTVGTSRGVSIEIAKKPGGTSRWMQLLRGKLRLGLMTSGDVSLSAKAKYEVAPGLEIHAGPQVTIQGVSFEVAIATELEPVVEEQEGAFPTQLHWSVAIQYPDEVTVALKLTRGGFSFNFPLELPVAESKWALIGALAAWTFAPMLFGGLSKSLGWAKALSIQAPSDEGAVTPEILADGADEGEAERRALQPEADERRRKEEQVSGLVILEARYGDIDVTPVLMARVRGSSLILSATSKASLVGIRSATAGRKLVVKYTYANRTFDRTFNNNELVILP